MISPLLSGLPSDLVHTEFPFKVKHVIRISRILTKSTWPPQTRSQFFRQLLSGRALEKHNVTFCTVISVLREVSRNACVHAFNSGELRWTVGCNSSTDVERERQPERSWDITVGQAIRLRSDRPRNRGSIPGNGKKIFCSPICPDGL